MKIDGARVLLTGATGGIGNAIARALHAQGATLTLTGRRMDVLEPLAAEIGATSIAADLADPADVERLIAASGDVDILIANAALPGTGYLLDLDDEVVDKVVQVNLRTPIVMARRFGLQMRERGSGHIVLIGSLAGKTASPAASLYNATKFGMRGFAQSFRQDLKDTGVGVSLVAPGFVREAGMFAEAGVALPRAVRTVTPEDVAKAVVGAIQHDRSEVEVAPVELKVAAAFSQLLPDASAALQRLVAMGIVDGLAEGQAKKRS